MLWGLESRRNLAAGLMEICVKEAGFCFILKLADTTLGQGAHGGPPTFEGVASLCFVEHAYTF